MKRIEPRTLAFLMLRARCEGWGMRRSWFLDHPRGESAREAARVAFTRITKRPNLYALVRLALIGFALSSCVDTIGPFVRTVKPLPDGTMQVESCAVELHRGFFWSASLDMGECHTKILKD